MASTDAPRTRRSFARLNKVLDVPHLIDIQRRSFEWLTDPESGGLRETINDISPIEDYTGNLAVEFGQFIFDDPVAPIEECREKDLTYARPLKIEVSFINRETGEIRQQEVFMGDFPWMTDWGTFIINGTERVVVTQLVRSPGAYLMDPKDAEKQVFIANLMPARGSWLELEIDKKGKVFVRIDRKRKLPITVLLRAMGYVTDQEIRSLFDDSLYIRNTIDSDPYDELPLPRFADELPGLEAAVAAISEAYPAPPAPEGEVALGEAVAQLVEFAVGQDAAAVDNGHAATELFDLAHDVRREDDAFALPAQLGHGLQQRPRR